jgi:hypothetical protein
MDAGGVGDGRGRRRGARRTWRSSPFSGVAWQRPHPPGGAASPVLSPDPPGWRRPLRAPSLLFRFHLHFTLPRTRARTHDNFSAARDALSAFPPLFTTPPASTLSLITCRTRSAPAPPPSRQRSPYFHREPGTLPPANHGGHFLPSSNWG